MLLSRSGCVSRQGWKFAARTPVAGVADYKSQTSWAIYGHEYESRWVAQSPLGHPVGEGF